ncbi:MAG: hypothetical protein HWD59_12945 [Coxiellaceae bacterium]|nr:MAG: hypothetical protein HWD59_12945 [Coxiellaceae bacterium]
MKIVIQQTEIPLEKMIYENFREANKLYAEDKYDEAIKKCDDILLKEKLATKHRFFLLKVSAFITKRNLMSPSQHYKRPSPVIYQLNYAIAH